MILYAINTERESVFVVDDLSDITIQAYFHLTGLDDFSSVLGAEDDVQVVPGVAVSHLFSFAHSFAEWVLI